jgi:hypothetical protein
MTTIPPDDIAEVHAPVTKESTEVAIPAEVVSKKRDNPLLGSRGFEFDLNSAIRFATGLADSGMAPKGMKAGAIVALLEAGRELGIAPMFALGNLTLVNGRLGIMGDAAKGIIRAAGVLKPGTDFAEDYQGEHFTEERSCTVSAWREGQPHPFRRTFSIEDAYRANLCRIWRFESGDRKGESVYQSKTRDGWDVTGPWATYTDRMLMYRALGFLVRDYFSDLLSGAVITEEIMDYPQIARGNNKAEIIGRFTEPCTHDAGPVTKKTPSMHIDEPPYIEEVCGGCSKPWKMIEEEREGK